MYTFTHVYIVDPHHALYPSDFDRNCEILNRSSIVTKITTYIHDRYINRNVSVNPPALIAINLKIPTRNDFPHQRFTLQCRFGFGQQSVFRFFCSFSAVFHNYRENC